MINMKKFIVHTIRRSKNNARLIVITNTSVPMSDKLSQILSSGVINEGESLDENTKIVFEFLSDDAHVTPLSDIPSFLTAKSHFMCNELSVTMKQDPEWYFQNIKEPMQINSQLVSVLNNQVYALENMGTQNDPKTLNNTNLKAFFRLVQNGVQIKKNQKPDNVDDLMSVALQYGITTQNIKALTPSQRLQLLSNIMVNHNKFDNNSILKNFSNSYPSVTEKTSFLNMVSPHDHPLWKSVYHERINKVHMNRNRYSVSEYLTKEENQDCGNIIEAINELTVFSLLEIDNTFMNMHREYYLTYFAYIIHETIKHGNLDSVGELVSIFQTNSIHFTYMWITGDITPHEIFMLESKRHAPIELALNINQIKVSGL